MFVDLGTIYTISLDIFVFGFARILWTFYVVVELTWVRFVFVFLGVDTPIHIRIIQFTYFYMPIYLPYGFNVMFPNSANIMGKYNNILKDIFSNLQASENPLMVCVAHFSS